MVEDQAREWAKKLDNGIRKNGGNIQKSSWNLRLREMPNESIYKYVMPVN